MVIGLLLLLSAPPEHSLLMHEAFWVESELHLLPTAMSYGNVLENFAAPVAYALEESGGFSSPDPERLSIYGDSTLWTQWYLNGINITDPLFDGAAALRAPFRMLRALALRYSEAPGSIELGGMSLRTGRNLASTAGVLLHQPRAGGIFPLAFPIMDGLSGLHSTRRDPPPPEERRRFGEHQRMYLVDAAQTPLGALRYGVDVELGSRRYLRFDREGRFNGIFEEGFSITSAGLELDLSKKTTLYVFGERRQRDNLFAELYHAEPETARMSSETLLLGLSHPGIQLGLLIKHLRITPNNRSFTKELVDPDGESTEPFFPDGNHLAATLDLTLSQGPLYLSLTNRALVHSPEVQRWSNPLTLSGAPYGRIDHRSRSNTQLIGYNRFGLKDRIESDLVTLDYNAHLAQLHAGNLSGQNALVLFDVGFSAAISTERFESFEPFFLIAKTPVPLTTALARTLDADHHNASLVLSNHQDSRQIDTWGGAHTTVKPGRTATSIYTAAAGFHHRFWKTWRLSVQGALKAYRGLFELQLEGGAERSGYFKDGVYYLGEGEKRYRLINSNRLAVYYGAHFQLYSKGPDHLVSVGFVAYNAVGNPPFGNGPDRNDIGVVHRSTANPNTEINRLANLDTDRAFLTKIMLGYRFWRGLWAFLLAKHRDGTPFAFFDVHEDNGQAAFTMADNRGSPLKLGRPLLGPREDFHLSVDLKLTYDQPMDGVTLRMWALFANLLDFGNELGEVFGPRQTGRAALESQVPRSILFGLELIQR